MFPHEPEYERMPFEVAARLPPAWDSPEHRQRIYGTFERLQIALAAGNVRQAHSLMIALRRLTEVAEQRRRVLTGEEAVMQTFLNTGRVEWT